MLSACDTGAGEVVHGEGLLSLQRAFRQAGASNVIAAAWPVDDTATKRLMAAFYRQLWVEGRSPMEALHSAQRQLLAENRRKGAPLPATWGAFILHGTR